MTIVVVIAPHPDDETLGCGGTLFNHVSQGHELHWIICSAMSEENGFSKSQIELRSKEIKAVTLKYGFSTVHKFDFDASKLDTYARVDVVRRIAAAFDRIQPNIIYAPYADDAHSDHGVVFESVMACTKSFRYPYVKKIRVYETISETEFALSSGANAFKPNLWIDISRSLDKKIEVMNYYSSEVGEHPFPRSEENIRALATFRGARAGVAAAEAFVSVLEILK